MYDILNFLGLTAKAVSIGDWNNPSKNVLVVLIYASLATIVLARTVSGAKSVTAPICFSFLCACGLVANKLLKDIHLPMTNELQHIMIFTTIGIIVGSLVLLASFRTASRGEG